MKKILFTLIVLFSTVSARAQVDITFRLNMKGQTFAFTTPEVNGTFNNWCGNCNAMTDADGDSIWEAVISLPNGIIEYKFSTDNWANQETLPQGTPCTIFTPPSFNNRKLIVINPLVLKAVCWGSCDTCAGGPVGPGLEQISLPITWQDTATVNYTTTDFGGTLSSIAADPADPLKLALKIVKGNTAETWAGTTLGTTAGFPTSIPFTPGTTSMQARVFSPASGTIFRLKAEDKSNPNISVETDAITSVANAWELLTFNFANPASGTPSIIFSNNYNKLSIFPNFGISGAAAGEQTYFVGDVAFGTTLKIGSSITIGISLIPNPSAGKFAVTGLPAGQKVSLNVQDLAGKQLWSRVASAQGIQDQIDLEFLPDGVYFLRISGNDFTKQAKIQIRH